MPNRAVFRPFAVALATAILTVGATSGAQARPSPADPGTGWTAFFDSGPYQDSGWAACSDPIGVSLDDTSKFLPDDAGIVATALTNAVQLWSTASPLTFEFSGFVPMRHDSDSGVTSPIDGVERTRHLYIAFVPDRKSKALTTRIVGLGLPTEVDQGNREITLAEATFERDYVVNATVGQVTALFAHEMGHALGLGHSSDRRDVMYPIVRSATKLGAGDVKGLQAIIRPCLDVTASRDYPLP